MTVPPHEDEPAEHRRHAEYLTALEGVGEADEDALMAAVLRDECGSTAESAVNRHLERRAAEQLASPGFPHWARTVGAVVEGRPFLAGRLREWTLLRSVVLDEPWTDDELLAASDWFQRTAADLRLVTSPRALALLAEHGRTRRVRNAAGRRIRRQGNSPA